jgi:hypothetical protein
MFYYNIPYIEPCENHSEFLFEEVSEDELIDISFTVSYYPQLDVWFSFHDYIPSGIFALRNKIISFNNEKIYIHNQDNYCKYYENLIYHSLISPVFKSPYKFKNVYHSATFTNLVLRCDIIQDKNVNRDKMLTSVSFYNSYQSTNIIPFRPFIRHNGFVNQYDIANVRLVKNYWNFNMLRDLKVDKDELTYEEWTNLKQAIFNYDVDVIGILNNYSTNTIEGRRRLSDEYLIVSLKYNNIEQLQFLIYEVDIKSLMR